ncbi:MAG: hypothetical protein PHV32_18075 [Eubacteriales bacterium]|nr:hypothetical protein [Eubacteriales bacterium]
MIAYHGSIIQGLSILKPFANLDSNLDYAAVYLTTYKPLAAIYIWNKPYKWMNYGFAEDGLPIYTESFPDALKEFYEGVSGCIYSCEGVFEYDENAKIKVAVISQSDVMIQESDIVPDCYQRILEYEKQGLMYINRFETLTDQKRESERRMILSAIKHHKLLQGNHPMAPFVKEKFPDVWKEAQRNENPIHLRP